MKNNCQIRRGKPDQDMYWRPFKHPDDDMYCYNNYNCTHQIKEKFGGIEKNHILVIVLLLAIVMYFWTK